ncbi:MAG: helix-turn-helix domain-containing protein [Flavobacteriaceae bacterium]|nr:helix-turn-helix domain-containing protein [Flavobacteriaceae bacterium]
MKKEELGKLIRARRKVLNLTIGKLAEYTGLSRTTISDIELGKIHSRLDVINEILRFLNLEMKIEVKQIK